MQNVRDQFITQFVSLVNPGRQSSVDIAGQIKGTRATQSQTLRAKLTSWATDKQNRRTVLLVLWVVLVLLLTCASTLALIFSRWLSKTYRPGILFAVALWAFTFGIAVLFFLSSKAVTTVFGGLLGISVDSATSGAGLLSKANDVVMSVSAQLEKAFGTDPVASGSFVRNSVWLFVIILMVTCLPAFFSDGKRAT